MPLLKQDEDGVVKKGNLIIQFNVTFPMTSKIEVNGGSRHPLYKYLLEKFPGDITWNFEKFLVNRQGEVIARFEPKQGPMNEDLRAAINTALAS